MKSKPLYSIFFHRNIFIFGLNCGLIARTKFHKYWLSHLRVQSRPKIIYTEDILYYLSVCFLFQCLILVFIIELILTFSFIFENVLLTICKYLKWIHQCECVKELVLQVWIGFVILARDLCSLHTKVRKLLNSAGGFVRVFLTFSPSTACL